MKNRNKVLKLICLIMCSAIMLSLCACGEGSESQGSMFAMGSNVNITAYGKNREAAISAAKDVVSSMDRMLDPDLPTSIVYTINRANGASTVISGQMYEMLNTAKLVYDRSGGAFDPSVYALTRLWGFDSGRYYLPSDEEISARMLQFCFDKMQLNSFPVSGSYTVTFPSYAEISFAAIAKGCAADSAIEAMRNAGVESAFINLGGNIQTLGLKPDGTKWIVGITNPSNPSSYLGVLNIGEAAVVTSGGYTNCFVASNGRTYGHILRPSSGYPVNNSIKSATVICSDGTMADCLATAMCVLGESGAFNYWRSYGKGEDGFEMILVTEDNRVVCTTGLVEEFSLSVDDYTLEFHA